MSLNISPKTLLVTETFRDLKSVGAETGQEEGQIISFQTSMTNSSFVMSEDEEIFTDATANQKRFGDQKNATSQESLADIFSNDSSMVNPTQQDQFAAALVRLQTDLSSTDSRLNAIEAKVDRILQDQRQRSSARAHLRQPRDQTRSLSILNRLTSTQSLISFAWPVVIYLMMRLMERRSRRSNS